MIIAIQIICVLILISLGAFFSGSETGVYRLSRLKLRIGIEQKRRNYKLLGRLMKDTHGLVFTILIGNNLVNYLASSLVTLLLLKTALQEHAELYVTAIMTPVLFVFSELVPKNMLYYRANNIMSKLAPLLWFFNKLFTKSGAVWLFKQISRPFASLFGTTTDASTAISASRSGQIRQIIRETSEEGVLSEIQSEIIKRLFKTPDITLGSVMTPASRTECIKLHSNRAAVLKKLKQCPYSRICVYESRRGNVIGYIRIYDVLSSERDFNDLRKFVQPIERFPASMPVIEAMNKMRIGNHKIVLVANQPDSSQSKQKFLGIVTMKDLVEELTGELAQW